MNDIAVPINEVISSVKQGKPLSFIADNHLVSVHKIRSMLRSAGTSVSELRPSVKTQISKHFSRWQEEKVTATQAAAELGVSVSSLLVNLKSLGLTLNKKRKEKPALNPELLRSADAVIERLITQGGTIRAIARDLGCSKWESQIRSIVSQRGIDPDEYRYMNRRFNDWLILPGKPQPVGPSDRILRCKCLRCGNDFNVHYSNLTSGKSKCCSNCADNTSISVVIKETGEIFRSIRSAVASLDCLEQYQKARLLLESTGEFQANGSTILLSDSTYPEQ